MFAPSPHDKIYPTAKVVTIVESLAAKGISTKQALGGTHISENDIFSPETRFSLNQILALCRNASRLAPDPLFAYHAGLRVTISAYGIYGFAILSCPDFHEMMQFAVKYHQLDTPLVDLNFIKRGNSAIWTVNPISHPLVDSSLYKFIVEFQIGIFMSLHRDAMGSSFAPREIRLSFEPTCNDRAVSDIFACPLYCGRSENAFVFDSAWLDHKSPRANSVTHAAMIKLCDELLEERRRQLGLAGRVRNSILMRLPSPIDADAVASDLNMSPRTLRRKLSKEKITFRNLVDELRMNLAIRYLRESCLTVDEISHAVGYSEPSGFRRAFRRWFRTTPELYRRKSRDMRTYHLS